MQRNTIILILGLSAANAFGGEDLSASYRRAGCPHSVSCLAAPAFTSKFAGYYVGGSKAHGGVGRSNDQGTFGFDYVGCWPFKKVMLNWRREKCEPGEHKQEKLLKRNGTGYRSDVPETPPPPVLKRL